MHLSAMDGPIENCEEINADDVHLLESIGKGSFGVVYKALWRSLMVAVKKVETESEVNEFYNEVQQLAKVQHENIIHLYGACTSGLYKCLVIEYADGGSLYHLLHNSPTTQYNLAHGISWLFQCAKAVCYLHSIQPRPLLHRDLKPPNLLLTKGAKVLKVCDFGTACELSTIMSDNRGSAAWMAPEVFEGKLYTEKCDVYSWGIIVWEVVTRRIPFEDLGLAVRIMWAVHQRQRPPLITGCPKLLENLMKRCWDHNQARRPRMEEVVEKMCLVMRFLKGAEEPISNPPSDDSITDSYRSACIGGSSAGHTSRDVSELTCSTGDLPHPPIPSSCCSSANSTRNHLHHHSFPNSHPHSHPNTTSYPHPDPYANQYHPQQLNHPPHHFQHPHYLHQYHHHHHNQQQQQQQQQSHNNNNAGFPAIHNEDALWLSSGSEGTFPLCDSPSREPSPRLTPAISPNVSSTVVMSGGRGSPWSSVGSLDPEDPCMQPLAITIPDPSPPTHSHLALGSLFPPTIALTPITANLGGLSPSGVPLRGGPSPGHMVDLAPQLRRRSAEVNPHTHSPGHNPLGHRRSSSFGSVVRAAGADQGGGGGAEGRGGGGERGGNKNAETAPPYPFLSPNLPFHPLPHHPSYDHHHHYQQQQQQQSFHHNQHYHHYHHQMPQYQIDPSIRDPGGSLGGLEGALKYPYMPALLPPTPSLSPSTTTTTNGTTTTTTLIGTTTTITAFPSWLPYPLFGPEPDSSPVHVPYTPSSQSRTRTCVTLRGESCGNPYHFILLRRKKKIMYEEKKKKDRREEEKRTIRRIGTARRSR